MPVFKLMIEDLQVYGCTIVAKDMDEAQDRFHEELDQTGDYHEACKAFDVVRDYDGAIEEMWYDEGDEDD